MARRSGRDRRLERLGVLAMLAALPGCRASEENPPLRTPTAEPEQVAAGPAAPAGATVAFGKALVIFGRDTVVAEVASTPAQRERGLMYRRDIPAGTGMMFVFPEEGERSFWMSNTYVALDVAFFDASMRVVDVQQMEAETTDFHDSRAPAMYALEVPKGWLAAHGVRVGTRARMVVGAR